MRNGARSRTFMFARLAFAAAALTMMSSALGYAQIYMQISGMEGESKDKRHERWIEVASARFPESSSTGAATTGTTSKTSAAGAAKGTSASNATGGDPGPPDTAVHRAIVSPRDPQSGLPTGKRMHQSIVITKPVDKTSPRFRQAQLKGEAFKEVVIELYRGTTPVQRYRLKDVVVSAVQGSVARAGDARLSETITLAAAEIIQEK